MFRLHVSGLPKDPVFPHDLKELGYFINDEDEIRSTGNHLQYFNYFLNKNERVNNIQREAMNSCIREEVICRLHACGLETTLLPLGVTCEEPHIPILTSNNLSSCSRVIVLFYEHTQDLGVLAHRVLGGTGGVNKGSCTNLVKAIQALRAFPGESTSEAPGIILANLGQLRFNRRQHKAMTQTSWLALPQSSAVGHPPRFDLQRNTVEGNRSTIEHVAYIMDKVIPKMCAKDSKIDIIGVSDGAVEAVSYLNTNFEAWERRLGALALCAPYHSLHDISNAKFAKWFEKRARAYVVSNEPANIVLSGLNGARQTQAFGCPAYSIGEPYYSELMLVHGHTTILDFFQEVHTELVSFGDYSNPAVYIFEDESEVYDANFSPAPVEDKVVKDGDEVAWAERNVGDADKEGLIGDGVAVFGEAGVDGGPTGEHKEAIEYLKEKARRAETLKKLAPNVGL